MARPCSVCALPDRNAVDQALVAGEPCRVIAAKYRVTPDAVERHKANHLPATLVKAQDAADIADADRLLDQVKDLQSKTLGILAKAEKKSDLRTALQAIGQARNNLELLAKLMGELDERPQVNILIAPEWLLVRSAMLSALVPYPEARTAVAGALMRLEAGSDSR